MSQEVIQKIKEVYLFSNLDSFKMPNLAKICREHDADYQEVHKIYKEEDWYNLRLDAQETYRIKSNEAMTAAIEASGINLGARVMEILQTTAMDLDQFDSLVNKRLLDALQDETEIISFKDLLAFKKLISDDKQKVVQRLLDIVKMLNEKDDDDPSQSMKKLNETLNRLLEGKSEGFSKIVVHTEATRALSELEGKPNPTQSYEIIEESERKEIFGKLDRKNDEETEEEGS